MKMNPELFFVSGGPEGVPSDEIRLSGLRLETVLGVREDERTAPRAVVADVRLFLDLCPAARSDELSDTVDYAALADRLRARARRAAFRLLEALAAALADEALADPRVRAVAVTLEKPGAVPGAEIRAALFRTAAPKK